MQTAFPVLIDHVCTPDGRVDCSHPTIVFAVDVAEGGQPQVLVVAAPKGRRGHGGSVVGLLAVRQAVLKKAGYIYGIHTKGLTVAK